MSRIGANNMHIKLICFSLMLFSASSVFAANTVTFYRDGALFQQDAVATKGVVLLPLAADLLEQTLTVIPAPGTTILGVETVRKESGTASDKELEMLTEQRRRLEDRLQALDAREAIFTTAAKSQSGKAPRKTKSNPDPIQAIRQGTDFAIAQLEAVYTARRKTTQEIHKIDARLAAGKKGRQSSEQTVRITVTPARGNLTLRYATSARGWQPQYNLYLMKNGAARLQLSAQLTGSIRGYQTRVSSGLLAEHGIAETLPIKAGSTDLASYHMLLSNEQFSEGIFNSFYGKVTNSSPSYLPPGESGLYRGGTFIGKFRFEGLSSGRSAAISLRK